MLATASAQVRNPVLPQAEPPSLGATIRHGFAIGIAATIAQILIALGLLYACGILAP